MLASVLSAKKGWRFFVLEAVLFADFNHIAHRFHRCRRLYESDLKRHVFSINIHILPFFPSVFVLPSIVVHGNFMGFFHEKRSDKFGQIVQSFGFLEQNAMKSNFFYKKDCNFRNNSLLLHWKLKKCQAEDACKTKTLMPFVNSMTDRGSSVIWILFEYTY